jgi:chemotaxis protein MotB
MRRALWALPIILAGCVSSGTYDAAVSDAEAARKALADEKGRAAALDTKIAELTAQAKELDIRRAIAELEKTNIEARIADTERTLVDKEAARKALDAKVAELTALNDELSKSKKKLADAKADLEKHSAELEKKSSEYEGLAQSLKGEIEAGKVELSELKGKMTVKMKDKILFASGSATIGPEGRDALKKVADAFKTLRGRIVRVEGHTDSDPTARGGPFPTNWELSTGRALAVVKFLQEQGVDPTILSAAGYGQYQPVAPNDSAENKSLNRRIEIVLANAEPAAFVPAAASAPATAAPAAATPAKPAAAPAAATKPAAPPPAKK